MIEKNDNLAPLEKALGVVSTVGLVSLFAAGLRWVSVCSQVRLEGLLAQFPSARFLWLEDPSWVSAVPYLVILAPIFALPGAFGFKRFQGMPRLGLEQKVALIVALLIVGAGGLVAIGWREAKTVGIAQPDEVIWAVDGVVVARKPWAAASLVDVACVNLTTRRNGVYSRTINYDIQFADGRSARLPLAFLGYPSWLQRIGPIEAELRRTGVRRRARSDEGCLDTAASALPEAQESQLRSIFQP